MAEENVHYELNGNVALITLDRPPRNAYTTALHAQLEMAWQRAADDPAVHVIVQQANGEHFCAGGELGRGEEDAEHTMTAWDFFRLCREVPKPTIAAVQGACVGGGLRFVWPCDLVIASDDAFFRDPTVRFGLGGIQSHAHTWEYGPRLAKEMLFLGGRLPARRLYEIGVINRIVERERLHEEALEMAQEIAEQPPRALREAKRASNMTMDVMGYHYVYSRFAELLDGFDSAVLHDQ